MSDAPVISVRGEAVLEVEPEIAHLSVLVQSQEKDQRTALDRLVERNQAALEEIKSHGEAIEKLDTGGLSITPVLKEGRRQGDIRAYKGTVWIRLVVADFAVLGELVTKLGDMERAYVHGPDWGLRRDSEVYKQAARQAANEAVARARSYAEALGARLTGLVELADEGLTHDTRHQRGYEAMTLSAVSAGTDAGGPPPIDLEPATQIVRATVEARFTSTAPELG